MKSDTYQPLFFDEFIDGVKICSQYISTFPNYDNLENKTISISDNIENNLTFILPLVESKFVIFNKNNIISFLNDNFEVVENFELNISEENKIFLGNIELEIGKETKITGNILELNVIYLYSEEKNLDKEQEMSFSMQIISVEYNKKTVVEGE